MGNVSCRIEQLAEGAARPIVRCRRRTRPKVHQRGRRSGAPRQNHTLEYWRRAVSCHLQHS